MEEGKEANKEKDEEDAAKSDMGSNNEEDQEDAVKSGKEVPSNKEDDQEDSVN